ncbi:neuroblastoma breakpoint family member 6-like [Sapajus apella]|uniref:Neuroblastoma breakpoint family member 6-like n=1 Tax=Sapajus apella TaxID=9515 RepID=A0A6J3IEK5_SAPAP|nr:neuroblastoma breakpoint family member 6-like [Sapajus apella]
MVVTAVHLSQDRAEMKILEINQELRSQLAESQQQFKDLKEKFLISQATAYSLAKQLKKYKCEEDKDIIDSVLRDEVQFIEEKLAEKLKQAEELRQYKALVHSQAKELTQLREKLRERRDASRSLNKHFKALLTPDDPNKSQGQDLREQLAEGCRLAERLVNKLSPENDEDEDEDEDVTDEETENIQESPAPREVQKAEEKEFPQDLREECAVICSNSYSTSDCNQPHRSAKVTFEGNKVDSALAVDSECSQDEGEEPPNILPGNQNDHEEEEGKVPMPPRNGQSVEPGELTKLRDFLTSPDVCLFGIITMFTISHRDPSISFLLSSLSAQFTEHLPLCLLLETGKDGYVFLRGLLSWELPEVKEQEVPEDSLDEIYLTPSVHHDLSDCHQPYSSTLSSLDDQLACSALDVASPTQEACPQGTCSGDWSYHLAEVQASQTQLEPSTRMTNCLQLQLDQGIDFGNGLARQGLSSTTCSFTANADPGTQCPFQELVLEPSAGMKNPLQLEDDALEGSVDNTQERQVIGHIDHSSVLKPKSIKRKLPFSKWIPWLSRLGCRAQVLLPEEQQLQVRAMGREGTKREEKGQALRILWVHHTGKVDPEKPCLAGWAVAALISEPAAPRPPLSQACFDSTRSWSHQKSSSLAPFPFHVFCGSPWFAAGGREKQSSIVLLKTGWAPEIEEGAISPARPCLGGEVRVGLWGYEAKAVAGVGEGSLEGLLPPVAPQAREGEPCCAP